jgi:hypothetical protein
MKVVGLNEIDYWQGIYATRRGLKSRFGVRVREGRCWALVQLGDDEITTFGYPHQIPVDLTTLPLYLRMIVDDHQRGYQGSDLLEVMAGKKSFREAIGLPEKTGCVMAKESHQQRA